MLGKKQKRKGADTVNSIRVWLYYRISRDDDKELNSLNNQKQILIDYAESKEYEIVGESFDDNVSGMHFQRDGIEELQEAAEQKLFDAVLVKDLSRLGRHKIQTAMFIDYLRQCKVRVISATESIDTSNENDDLIVGVKQLLNDQYSRDLGRKIKSGYKQKQKKGIVIIPPFGYKKDKNTNKIIIVDECADIVRKVFELYIEGLGYRRIAIVLTESGYMTPAYYQKLHYDKSVPYTKTKIGKQYIWSPKSVEQVLKNEAYIGTLYCGKTSKSTIYHTREEIDVDKQYRHENFYPPIISQETWLLTRTISADKVKNAVRTNHNKRTYKYAGLLRCADCEASFTSKKRGKDENKYIEYICTTYHRVGGGHCTSHKINESALDDLLYQELERMKKVADNNLKKVDEIINYWLTKRTNYDKIISGLEVEATEIENEIKELIVRGIKEPENRVFIDEIVEDNKAKLKKLHDRISELKNSSEVGNISKEKIENSVEILEKIIAERNLAPSHMHLIIEKILVKQVGDKQLELEFILKSPFKLHTDLNNILVHYTEDESGDKITCEYAA